MLVETGETVGFHSGEKFPMQSVFKLPIAVSILHRVDQGKISLEQKILVKKTDLAPKNAASEIRDQHPEGNIEMSVRDLLHAMMDVSDGTACDVLLRMAGGPVAVTKFMHSLGGKEISIAVSEKELVRTPALRYGNWATPRGTLELLRILQQQAPISRANRDLLLQFMAESRTGPQRIKGLLPQGDRKSVV
jgi:beta-lactamase class A